MIADESSECSRLFWKPVIRSASVSGRSLAFLFPPQASDGPFQCGAVHSQPHARLFLPGRDALFYEEQIILHCIISRKENELWGDSSEVSGSVLNALSYYLT